MTTFLLPARIRFGGQALSHGLAKALGRADRTQGEPGERAQLLRHFELLPRGWPVAAITRAFDANDAASATWLRADPAYVRPDINGARLLACGDAFVRGHVLVRRDALVRGRHVLVRGHAFVRGAVGRARNSANA